jgi:hypothetical protein
MTSFPALVGFPGTGRRGFNESLKQPTMQGQSRNEEVIRWCAFSQLNRRDGFKVLAPATSVGFDDVDGPIF